LREEYGIKFCMKLIAVISHDNYCPGTHNGQPNNHKGLIYGRDGDEFSGDR
jgi:hypothetical protein